VSADLLGRAVSLLPRNSDERLEVVPDLGVALTEAGRAAEAATLLSEAIEIARAAGDELHAERADVQLAATRMYLRDIDAEEVDRIARTALARFEATGDDVGQAQAWILIEYVDQALGDYRDGARSTLQAIRHAVRVGRRRELLQAVGDAPHYITYGLVGRDVAAAAAAEWRGNPDPALIATVHALDAMVATWDGDEAGFRRALRHHAEVVGQRGMEWLANVHATSFGVLYEQFGFSSEAVTCLEAAVEWLRAGDLWWAAGTEPHLVAALYRAGRSEAGLARALGEHVTGVPDDQATRQLWHIAECHTLRVQSRFEQAVERGREAIASVDATEMRLCQALAREALAEALTALGDEAEASRAIAEARTIYQAAGFVAGAMRLTSALGTPP
jgi:tetratricopeptide (TPR) repeat protein